MKSAPLISMALFAFWTGAAGCTGDDNDVLPTGQGGMTGDGQGGSAPTGGGGSGAGAAGTNGAGGSVCIPPTGGVTANSETRFHYGINYAWASFGSDFGNTTRGVAATRAQRLISLMDMKAHGVDIVRWWVFPNFQGGGVTFDAASGGAPTGLGGSAPPRHRRRAGHRRAGRRSHRVHPLLVRQLQDQRQHHHGQPAQPGAADLRRDAACGGDQQHHRSLRPASEPEPQQG